MNVVVPGSDLMRAQEREHAAEVSLQSKGNASSPGGTPYDISAIYEKNQSRLLKTRFEVFICESMNTSRSSVYPLMKAIDPSEVDTDTIQRWLDEAVKICRDSIKAGTNPNSINHLFNEDSQYSV